MRARMILCLLFGLATPAMACETALLLAIDVSNSVDDGEYRLQIDGLADALADPAIIDVIVDTGARIAVVQWSGIDEQTVQIGWTALPSRGDVTDFAMAVRLLPRAFSFSGTAPADAIMFSLARFDDVSDCDRHVIDISGDGVPNAGGDTRTARQAAERQAVTINAIAIESMGVALTNFFRQSVITSDGFVVTATGHRDYPRAIRAKLLRELSRLMG